MIGTPTVTTSVGAEGLNLRNGEHVLVADSPTEFATAMERLVTDPDLWQRMVHSGRELVQESHGPAAVRAGFTEMVSTVLTMPPKSLTSYVQPVPRLLAHA
jgi:glycosyltransferase involved in cell wall biosynthesis